jgi:hypothetical protein
MGGTNPYSKTPEYANPHHLNKCPRAFLAERPRTHGPALFALQLQTLVWTTHRIAIQPLYLTRPSIQTNIIEPTYRKTTARIVKTRLLLPCILMRNLDL